MIWPLDDFRVEMWTEITRGFTHTKVIWIYTHQHTLHCCEIKKREYQYESQLLCILRNITRIIVEESVSFGSWLLLLKTAEGDTPLRRTTDLTVSTDSLGNWAKSVTKWKYYPHITLKAHTFCLKICKSMSFEEYLRSSFHPREGMEFVKVERKSRK